MNEKIHCSKCGNSIPSESPRVTCPACLMEQAMASRTIVTGQPDADLAPPPSPEDIADKFPNYEILECLGRGGMGVVYKARQKSLDRWVAIKVLAPERVHQERFAEHFEREAKTLAKMNHPNIVTVFDHGKTDGLFYIVMEFVDGVNLRDLLREGKLEPEHALAIVPLVCEALEYAHGKGIVHRDIKPENLLLDRDGRVKIADFGIASLVGATGEKSGTPPYMAPEQSGGTVDRRADIYALGVVLYEMLTGERPERDLVAPSRKVSIDVRIDEIVLRALEIDPELRYQQASVMRTRLETLTAPDKTSKNLRDKALHWLIHLAWAVCVSGLFTLTLTFVSEILTRDRGNLNGSLLTWEDIYGPLMMVLLVSGLMTIPVRKFSFTSSRAWIGAVFATAAITIIAYILAAPVENPAFHANNFIAAIGICGLGAFLGTFAADFGSEAAFATRKIERRGRLQVLRFRALLALAPAGLVLIGIIGYQFFNPKTDQLKQAEEIPQPISGGQEIRENFPIEIIERQNKFLKIMSQIESQYPEIYLGAEVGDVCKIYLKGEAPSEVTELVNESDLLIEVVDKLPYSLKELDEKREQAVTLVSKAGYTHEGSSIDVPNQIQIMVGLKDGLPSEEKEIMKLFPEDVAKIIRVETIGGKDEEPGVVGYVVAVDPENQRFLLTSYEPEAGLAACNNAIWFSKPNSDLKAGQKVKVWFSGMLESYPAQASAIRTEVDGGDLADQMANVIRLALEKRKDTKAAGIPFVVSVEHDKTNKQWKVLFASDASEGKADLKPVVVTNEEL